ncbi:hypothetical protein ACFQH6_15835 [Halobacteriaceae archaeon GCM10025711]
MTRNSPSISRRQLLAGLGTTGFVAGGMRVLTGSAVAYTNRTLAAGEGDLLVSWRETYNGDVVEASLPGDGDGGWPGGPVLSLPDVKPGDEGTLAVGLEATEDASDVRVWLGVCLRETAENGILEPEAAAGDTTPGVGELQDAVHATLWYDRGIFGLGDTNGSLDFGEERIASGTLADVATALSGWTPVDPDPATGGHDCFTADSRVGLGLEWSIDETVGNVVQSDSVRFDVVCYAASCGDDAAPPAGPCSITDASTTSDER